MRLPASRPLAAAVALGFALMTGCVPPTGTSSTPWGVIGSDATPGTTTPGGTPSVTGGDTTPDVPGNSGETTPLPSAGGTPGGKAQGCNESVAGLVAAPIPRGHDWVEVRFCQEHTVSRGDGDWQVRTDKVATSGLDVLIAALEQPDATSAPNHACPAVTGLPPQPTTLVLIDRDGRPFLARFPRAVCGGSDVYPALAALPWATTTTTDLYRIRTQAQIAGGCSDYFDPAVALVANGAMRWLAPQPVTIPGTTVVCAYGPDPDFRLSPRIDSTGQTHAWGRFVSVATLDDDRYAAFTSAVSRAPRAEACDLPDGPFAVVRPPDAGSNWLYAELGGCNRALIDGEDFVRQLDPATVALLG